MREADRKAKKYLEKKEKQLVAAKVREEKRNASFIPPTETPESTNSTAKAKGKKEQDTTGGVDVEKLKKKVKKMQNKMKKKAASTSS